MYMKQWYWVCITNYNRLFKKTANNKVSREQALEIIQPNTDHIKELDRGAKVWIFLVVLDDGGSQNMASTLNVNPRLIHRGQLHSLQVPNPPEQNLWTNQTRVWCKVVLHSAYLQNYFKIRVMKRSLLYMYRYWGIDALEIMYLSTNTK